LSFAEPQYLMALWAVPLLAALAVLMALRKRGMLPRMGEPGLLRDLAEGYSPDRRAFKTALVLAALACALLGAARPQAGWRLTRGATQGIDVAIALDVSASMLAEDVAPSRLGRAKSELAALMSGMKGDRVAIVAFAGSATAVCPLTADTRAAIMFLEALQTGIVEEPGTDVGEAIDRALMTFDRVEDRSRAVLVVSDGEDHEGGALAAATRAVEAGVRVYCVGVGSEDGVPIPVSPGHPEAGLRRDSDGQVVLTTMNERGLEEVASAGDGSMHVLGPSGGGLAALAAELNELPRKERPTTYTHRGERFQILALMSLFLLAVEWIVGERGAARASAAALALALSTLLLASPAEAKPADDAVRLYDKGDYLGALARFREALDENPTPALTYDAGNSLYRLGKFDEAARYYGGAAAEADSSLRMRARYNMGNSLFRNGDMRGAVDQYIEALKLNPSDADAKHNLELALRNLQAQRRQEASKGDKGEEGKESRQEGGESGRQRESRPEESSGAQEGGEDRSQAGHEDTEGRPEDASTPQGGEQTQARFSKEEAERLLEALAGDERDLLKKRLKAKVRRKGVKKDW
jgi:Ca-activated chloride channel family protein